MMNKSNHIIEQPSWSSQSASPSPPPPPLPPPVAARWARNEQNSSDSCPHCRGRLASLPTRTTSLSSYSGCKGMLFRWCFRNWIVKSRFFFKKKKSKRMFQMSKLMYPKHISTRDLYTKSLGFSFSHHFPTFLSTLVTPLCTLRNIFSRCDP